MSELARREGSLEDGNRDSLPDVPGTPRAYEEAARIRALCPMAETIHVQIMESLWVIQQEVGAELFSTFVARHTPLAEPVAQRMLETWRVARKRRDLRELAQRDPDDAIALISASLKAGVELKDATDEEVANILVRPERQRHRAIRDLIESAGSPSPGAAATVEALEAERDAAVEALHKQRTLVGHPRAREVEVLEALKNVTDQLAELRMDAQVVFDDDTPEPVRERVLELTDSAATNAERIADALYGDENPTQEGSE